MFAVPALIEAVFLPSFKQGIPDPVPSYEQILLNIILFFITRRFLLAIPVPFVLFAIAAFTSTRLGRQQHGSIQRHGDQRTSRPVGITGIAVLNILAGLALAVSGMLSMQRTEVSLSWMVIVTGVLSIGLGIALLRLQNWARAVVLCFTGYR
jgi:hypothetical protein